MHIYIGIDSSPVRNLQRQVIPNLRLGQLPERRRQSLARLLLHLLPRRHGDDSDFDRVLRHLTLETLLEGEKSSVDGILERQVIVISVCQRSSQVRHDIFGSATEKEEAAGPNGEGRLSRRLRLTASRGRSCR